MKKLVIGFAASALAISGVAIAANAADEGKGSAGWLVKHGDKNGDGAISREEFLAQAAEHFAQADANKDGKVTGDEIHAMMAAHHRGMGGDGNMRGHMGHPGGPGMMGGPGGGMMEMFTRLDTDGNGKVSLAEFNAPHDKHFAMVDANKDGQVDKDELKAAMEKMEQMHGAMRDMHGPGRPAGDMPPPPPPGSNPGE